MLRRVFVTGATGCIAHYVLEELLKEPLIEIHLAARKKERFKIDIDQYETVYFHEYNMEDPQLNKDILSKCHVIIHIATSWRYRASQAIFMNRDKTIEMFELADTPLLERIVYFSTASILGRENIPLKEAREFGTGYIKSKAQAYEAIRNHSLSNKIITLFPTVVFGGDSTHPYSHISEGVFENKSKLAFLRFLYPKFSFHFLHGRDIAKIAVHLALNGAEKYDYVIGQPAMKAKLALKKIAEYMNYRVWFQMPISSNFAHFLCKLFHVKLDKWAEYMIENPNFEYNVVRPEDFGMPSSFPSIESVLEDAKRGLEDGKVN